MTDQNTTPVAASYAAALVERRAPGLIELLAVGASFRSPFSHWQDDASVRAACVARCTAFKEVQVDEVIDQGDRVVLLWHAVVDGEPVEGCEVLNVRRRYVATVDVYLRPAPVLNLVRSAMRSAWPAAPA